MSTASDSLNPNNKDYQRYLAIKEEIRRMSKKINQTKTSISIPLKPIKKSISILLYAYRAADYIEECLDSIEKQSWFVDNNNYELLIGVDNCDETYVKLNEIKNKYRNITIYQTEKHLGLYVTVNTLLDKVKYNSILRFNIEDVMKSNMIEEILQYTDEYDIVKFDYDYFDEEITNTIKNKYWFNNGIFLFNNKVVNLAGGYKNWVYAADIELYERVYNFVKVKELEKSLFYKRHGENDIKFNKSRKLKNIYKKQIHRYDTNENIKIDKIFEIKQQISNTVDVDPINKNINITKRLFINKKPISIVITAHQSQHFIEECLDSIENQTYFSNNYNYEILLGIDACKDTLNKVIKIREKYRNLYVYMMKDNKGTYVTTNTLLDLVKYDNILRFDSDDIMMPDMISEIMKYIDNYDFIRFGFNDFTDNINNVRNMYMRAMGSVFYKKNVIDKAGGYRDWWCSADYDFFTRIKNQIKIKDINQPLFYRRVHSNSLSERDETGLNSSLRREYNKRVKEYIRSGSNDFKINKKINEYMMVDNFLTFYQDDNSIQLNKNMEIKKPISIIITAWQTQDYIEECLDSIETQTYFKNNHYFEVLVGIDNCSQTLNKILKIRHKYRNLRILMMNSNQGTYVTSNTLLNLIRYDNIIRFDSDDIMKPWMIEKIMLYVDNYDFIKFGYNTFIGNTSQLIRNKFYFPHGVVLYKKKIFDMAGGYQNWKCAADTELMTRIKPYVKIKEIEERLFWRRQHENSLTKNNDTKHGSSLRIYYKSLIGRHTDVKIEKITNEYTEY